MAKAANKTTKTKDSVAAFLASVEDATRQSDAKAVVKMMQEVTGEAPARVSRVAMAGRRATATA